jgi:hypothetical protein
MVPEIIQTLGNVIMAFAAVVGVRIAWLGLNTWRDQLVWEADNELAKKVIGDVYSHRDAVFRFRRTNLAEDELEIFESRGGGDRLEFDALMHRMEPIFTARFDAVIDASSKLQATFEEARFHWGKEFPDEFHEIFLQQLEISDFLRSYYGSLPKMEPELRKTIRGQLRKMLAVISDAEEDSDTRRREFRERVEAIEQYLRGKIGRS